MTETCEKCKHNQTDISKYPCSNCRYMQPMDSKEYTVLPTHFEQYHDGCEGCINRYVKPDKFPCSGCKGTKVGSAYYVYPDLWQDSKEAEQKAEEKDMVNHPPHYCREGAMECFDEFVMIYGKVPGMYACLFNMHKYRYRSPDKGGDEDYLKSDWYVRKYKQLKEEWEEEQKEAGKRGNKIQFG